MMAGTPEDTLARCMDGVDNDDDTIKPMDTLVPPESTTAPSIDGDLDDAAPFGAVLVPAEAEIAHQLLELRQHAQVDLVVVLAEFDQQDRFRRLAHELVERRLEDRNLARELDHRAVDQFHCDRLEPHDVLR